MNDYHSLVTDDSSAPGPQASWPDLDAAIAMAITTAPAQPEAASEDEWFDYSVRMQRHLNDYGLVGLEWPAEYGGRGLDPVAAAGVMRRLSVAGVPELANYVGIDVLAPVLIELMEPARLARWLPAMAAATEVWCQLFSEPEAGSDLASLRCKAEPDGDGWRVSGQKVWSTWAHYATWGVLLARTGTTESRHRGITAFVVDMSTPGIDVRPLRTMTGTAHFAEVFLDDVRLPGDAVIGEVGRGWAVTMQFLDHERGSYPASRGGLLRRAYLQLRNQVPAGLPPEAAARLGRIEVRLDALDALAGALIGRMAAGETLGPDAAVSKVLLSRTEQLLYDEIFAWSADGGLFWPGQAVPRVIQDYLYSIAATIYGGARNIQLNIIAERGLGLPR
jgi:alkylation response protein AidB-like acyl-CoA dehydrogenase